MSTEQHNHLFGPDRKRVGYEEQEWSVWVLGLDDIHDKHSLAEALEQANELNATFAHLRLCDSSEFAPVLYAVVLHHGYAWTQATEHAHGVDCGHPDCGPCSLDRAQKHDQTVKTALHCTRCWDVDGPFTPSGLCEPCARPMPLDGVA